MKLKVYLDTCVMIEGERRQEHKNLVKLSVEGQIELYYGDEVSIEIREKISNLRDEKGKALREYNEKNLEEFSSRIKKIEKDIKNWEEQVDTELQFWKKAKPRKAENIFRGVMLISEGMGMDFALKFDFKNEVYNLCELIEKFNIKPMDAIHAMQAHSSEINYFLTWDDNFIKKAKCVQWLAPKFMTPKEFL